ncbi:oligoendopeptidase F domain protein, partial [Clostridioides difficile F249]
MGTDRSTIEEKYKWKIDKMYSSKEEIEKDISKVKNLIQEVKEYKGKLSESKENLYKVLN